MKFCVIIPPRQAHSLSLDEAFANSDFTNFSGVSGSKMANYQGLKLMMTNGRLLGNIASTDISNLYYNTASGDVQSATSAPTGYTQLNSVISGAEGVDRVVVSVKSGTYFGSPTLDMMKGQTKFGQNPSYRFADQLSCLFNIGAIRMEEEKVFVWYCARQAGLSDSTY